MVLENYFLITKMLFSKEEYKTRLKKVQKSMQEKGIELLISQDTNNMNYLTGYDAWSFYYTQCVMVHINAEEPLCFVRAQDAGGAYIKTYLKYIHTWPMHPYDPLVELIKKNKWDNLTIGVEMDSHYFTAYCYEKLKQGLPKAKIKDSERLVNWVRFLKSDAEINLMKGASLITEKSMKVAIDSIKPGVRQCDAVAEIQRALFRGTPEIGGEYSSIATLLPTGKGTSASHLTATDEKFVEGEATIIDAMKATNEALDAGIAATKPGNTANDVAQKFWAVLDKYNIKKESRTGYSIGIGYPPDWGEHTLNIYKGEKTILQPNACFHMIAVMQFGDWGVEASESVRVTETGSELFCNFSRELHIK